MNILFLTIGRFENINQHGIYPDLLRACANSGHNIYIVSPREKRLNLPTKLVKEDKCLHLFVKIGNITKTNIVEKGISTMLIETKYKSAIKKYFSNVKFDLVLYSTPPITFVNAVKYVKKRDNAKTYLLLKDIFPQNAVDLKILSKKGIKGFIYKYFRNKEKKLYKISDLIGTMSEANSKYLLTHNTYINKSCVHISPNSIDIIKKPISEKEKTNLKIKYNLPTDKTIFIYGGNLGKPQNIPFVIKCLKANENKSDRFFVICGTGTEYNALDAYIKTNKPKNVLLINGLPKSEYEDFVSACDVGLIFLDHNFTIPNFPSRLLSYMQSSMPVIACTDTSTDIGNVITNWDFGWWCESNNVDNFTNAVEKALNCNLTLKGKNAYSCLNECYSAQNGCTIIMNALN